MTAVRIEENGNVQKILRGSALEGTVVKHGENHWEYVNCLGHKGTAKTEHAAFVHLGFKKK